MGKVKSEKGVLTLEASISLVVFIFLMLYLYSFFVFFEARNEMAHVVLQTTNSLAFDPLGNEKLENSGDLTELFVGVYNTVVKDKTPFVSHALWNEIKDSAADAATDGWRGDIYVTGSTQTNEDGSESAVQYAAYSDSLKKAVEDRFYAYLCNGDMAMAKKIFNRYHISNISFVGTKVASGKLTVVLTYDIDMEFKVFGAVGGKRTLQQSACSKLWK